uniref:Uncharacterized protein n=1 Tax=Chaetoceros debilis TaxID=122233 RepID=A0A7S3Q8D5_9STRA|mmetsp:Transcript_6017/g.8852  ORF Transcript_6017/g.8852 Transcript_6017/m.8852 type:complete len:105 (+) Transcript_6017:33-347(+)
MKNKLHAKTEAEADLELYCQDMPQVPGTVVSNEHGNGAKDEWNGMVWNGPTSEGRLDGVSLLENICPVQSSPVQSVPSLSSRETMMSDMSIVCYRIHPLPLPLK